MTDYERMVLARASYCDARGKSLQGVEKALDYLQDVKRLLDAGKTDSAALLLRSVIDGLTETKSRVEKTECLGM